MPQLKGTTTAPTAAPTAVQTGTHFPAGACLSFESARVGTGLLVCGGDFVAMSWLSTLAQASDSIFERVTCSLVFARSESAVFTEAPTCCWRANCWSIDNCSCSS